ncbi:MAG: hypothetical protein J1E37_05875 [Prevotella sp.]|nr:hypothetical protein [Prevotella sp.]
MISFIVCSINPDRTNALQKNIAKTVGVDYEFIVEDNRGNLHGICKAYNDGARKAKYENLCFVHEDVVFRGESWGIAIEEKLSEPQTGIIGFMGTIYKSKAPSGWNVLPNLNRSHFIQTINGQERFSSEIIGDFSPCVILDGACLFMNAKLWNKHHFDEIACPGFHCYDIDICIQATCAGYINYVCGTCWVEHFSAGVFSIEWARNILSLHLQKWNEKLPLGDKLNSFYEARAYYVYLKNVYKLSWNKTERMMLMKLIPFKIRHPIIALKSITLLLNL